MSITDIRLTGFLADKLPKILYLVGAVSLIISYFLSKVDGHHFYFSYLTSYTFFLAATLGSLFFVIIQHLSSAGWSVTLRRVPEVIMQNFLLLAFLFIPILFGMHDLYHWTHTDAVAHDTILQGKVPYLNIKFFIVRAVLFFVIWILIARKFFKSSIRQDSSGEKSITQKLRSFSAPAVILFALSQTFASIDWVMSLTPHWYSTMWGVYFFAISIVLALALITFVLLILRKYGFLKDTVTVEHYHDMGKLLYGFNIFWTYIAFSQYFLIWYGNIPEETAFYHQHFQGSWEKVALFLVIGHFLLPLIFFMSRHVKRNLKTHFVFVVWMMFISFVDIYWIIMPNLFPQGISLSVFDIFPFLGIGGLYFAFIFKRLAQHNLIPKSDPRLPESLKFHNF